MPPAELRLIRKRSVSAKFERSGRHVESLVQRRLLTRPIKLSPGPTTPSAWPEHEIDAIINARIRGASDDEIRVLVRELEAARVGASAEVAQ
jgi:prophage regulatory protein